MKRKIVGVLSVLATTMFVALPAVQAQSHLIANVPFDFHVGKKAMAAGSYEVLSISEQVDLVNNMDTGVAAFVVKAIHVQGMYDEGAKLVFNKYGNQYFLSQIWDGRSNVGIELPKSKRETELALAERRTHGFETITVAMK